MHQCSQIKLGSMFYQGVKALEFGLKMLEIMATSI